MWLIGRLSKMAARLVGLKAKMPGKADEEIGVGSSDLNVQERSDTLYSLWWLLVPGSFVTFGSLAALFNTDFLGNRKAKNEDLERRVLTNHIGEKPSMGASTISPITPKTLLYPYLSQLDTQTSPDIAVQSAGASDIIGTVFHASPTGTPEIFFQAWNLTASESNFFQNITEVVSIGDAHISTKRPVAIVPVPDGERFFIAFLTDEGRLNAVQVRYDGTFYLDVFKPSATSGYLVQLDLMVNIFASFPRIDLLSCSGSPNQETLALTRLKPFDNTVEEINGERVTELLTGVYDFRSASISSSAADSNFTLLAQQRYVCGSASGTYGIAARTYEGAEASLLGVPQCPMSDGELGYGSPAVIVIDATTIASYSGPNRDYDDVPTLFLQRLNTRTGQVIGPPVVAMPINLVGKNTGRISNDICQIGDSNGFVFVFIAHEAGSDIYNTYIRHSTLSGNGTIVFLSDAILVDASPVEYYADVAVASLSAGQLTVQYKEKEGGIVYKNYATESSFAPEIVADTFTAKRDTVVDITLSDVAAHDQDNQDREISFTTQCKKGHFALRTNPDIPLPSFLQADVDDSRIGFRHIGGWIPPTCNITATDPGGRSSSTQQMAIVFDPMNQIPQVTVPSGLSVQIGGNTTFNVTGWALDDGPPLLVLRIEKSTGGPAEVWVTLQDGQLIFSPPLGSHLGDRGYKLIATDGLNATGEDSFTMTLVPQVTSSSTATIGEQTTLWDVFKVIAPLVVSTLGTGLGVSIFAVSTTGTVAGIACKRHRNEVADYKKRAEIDLAAAMLYKAVKKPWEHQDLYKFRQDFVQFTEKLLNAIGVKFGECDSEYQQDVINGLARAIEATLHPSRSHLHGWRFSLSSRSELSFTLTNLTTVLSEIARHYNEASPEREMSTPGRNRRTSSFRRIIIEPCGAEQGAKGDQKILRNSAPNVLVNVLGDRQLFAEGDKVLLLASRSNTEPELPSYSSSSTFWQDPEHLQSPSGSADSEPSTPTDESGTLGTPLLKQ